VRRLLRLQVKKTAYAQTSQIRQIRRKMVEIMTREAQACDLKELVGKFIPEAIGARARPLADTTLCDCVQ
jgi:ribosomal protein S3AE